MNKTSANTAIRKAEMQDAAALKTCIERAYAPVRLKLSDLPDVSAGIEEDIAGNEVFIAETDGCTAGCAILSFDGSRAHLSNIAVDPDFKGQGIGTALIGAVEAAARAKEVLVIHLATHVSMPENVALYSRLGWLETQRTGNKVLMEKSL
ncbi:GNAT family N-acetyltransferase [uncultured Roseibium sp.]|uniref:GNAT family N-acetyltransferase n=1 Tax=uncultured Roseibium sp. TaxID=1936171 RepID=UPI00260E265A|nr:GNAT family N-acetyltransferase [uncultured Roseibium sp.]